MLQELLNKIIQRGWKPRGEEEIKSCQIGESFYERKFIGDTVGFYEDDRGTPQWLFTKSLRELCAKESGLWQFVCNNGMIKNVNDYSWELYSGTHGQHEVYKNGYEGGERWEQVDYEYRLIESALCDEDKLEQFLLDNIKIDE